MAKGKKRKLEKRIEELEFHLLGAIDDFAALSGWDFEIAIKLVEQAVQRTATEMRAHNKRQAA
jgi:hypothetical protein